MANISNIKISGVVHNIVDDEAMRLASNPTNNDILIVDSTGQAIDSGKTLNDYQEKLTGGNGIDITGNVISSKFEALPAGTDLNDIKYNYHGYVSSPTNGPSSYTSGMVSVVAHENGSNVMQLHHYYNGDRMYVRYYREATGWHDWYAIMQRPLQALWVNESSASAFAPQTISLDLTGFLYVVIVFRQLTSNTIHEVIIATPNGYDFLAHSILTTGTTLYKRTFTARTNGIQFYIGRKDSNTEDNTVMIPRYIYGIR